MSRKMHLGQTLAAVAVILATGLAAACGGSSSPTTPTASPSGSPVSSSPTTSGATISGTIDGAASSGSTGMTALGTGGTITVTIAGTSITVTVDASGRFVLTGVPAGSIELMFTYNGVSSTITLPAVQERDQITLRIRLRDGTCSLESEQRNGTEVTEIEGRIAAIAPGGAARTLIVDDRTVSVPEAAIIRHGGTTLDFAALKIGYRVHVRGAASGDVFAATEVNVQNMNADVSVNASGTVSAVEGGYACPAIRFTLSSWVVETDAKTTFKKGACSAIAVGATVHVKGDIQETGRVLASWVQVGK